MKSTIHLTKKDVGDIIKNYFEEQGYTGIGNVFFDVTRVSEGYGSMESDSYVFDGANIDVEVRPIIIRTNNRTTEEI